MKSRQTKSLILLAIGLGFFGVTRAEQSSRPLYTYSFGGLEDMAVPAAADLLHQLGYAGVATEARGEASLTRMDQYYDWRTAQDTDFVIPAAYMAHRFDQYGFSDAAHKAAIDRLADKQGTLWVWVRDAKQDGSIAEENVEAFIRGIFEYALSKNVKIVLYPHYNTYYPTTHDAMRLVRKIDHPSFQIAINLCHELMSDRGDELAETFEQARGHIGAIILSGSLVELDRTSVRSVNASTIKPLDESVYDLRPFMRLIKESDFKGPIGYINFKPTTAPADYLARTMKRWKELCAEVGLYAASE